MLLTIFYMKLLQSIWKPLTVYISLELKHLFFLLSSTYSCLKYRVFHGKPLSTLSLAHSVNNNSTQQQQQRQQQYSRMASDYRTTDYRLHCTVERWKDEMEERHTAKCFATEMPSYHAKSHRQINEPWPRHAKVEVEVEIEDADGRHKFGRNSEW